MISVRKIASYLCARYLHEFGRPIDEMKLHKLLYFAQRECIIQKGEPMFPEQFYAWKYGPVMVSIRQGFKQGKMQDMPSEEEIVAYQMVFDSIFKQYAPKSSMSLSTLSHGEYSWRHARGESMPDGHCDALLDVDDIRVDAERVKIRRFLLGSLNKMSTTL